MSPTIGLGLNATRGDARIARQQSDGKTKYGVRFVVNGDINDTDQSAYFLGFPDCKTQKPGYSSGFTWTMLDGKKLNETDWPTKPGMGLPKGGKNFTGARGITIPKCRLETSPDGVDQYSV